MVYTENIAFLQKNFYEIRSAIKNNPEEQNTHIEKSKSGAPTLKFTQDGENKYLHSKYDPWREAESLVRKFSKELNEKTHVFFYGVGLGYHVELIAKQYPHLSLTLYEPKEDIFQCLINTRSIHTLGDNSIKQLFVETPNVGREQFFHKHSDELSHNVLFVSLPSYERVFKEEYQNFLNLFVSYLKDTRSNLKTNYAYEKLWTINSLINLKHTVKTPNILQEENKALFKNRPVLIVAAGPSLYQEIDNLRYIKENKLAYIFAVGSANNTLVEYDIYPDAVCTYDPQPHNHIVFEKAINKEADIDIPMIFGTSVGYETLEKYRGPKAYMVTTQDTVSSYFLKLNKKLELPKVKDAPSIAVVTTELLSKLGCDPIIFVGQNLAYLDGDHYSKGINYQGKPNKEKDYPLDNLPQVKNVAGKEIQTNESFLRMKAGLENTIRTFRNTNFINTTQEGADIEGTVFLDLKEVIEKKLEEPQVDVNWYENLTLPVELKEFQRSKIKMDKNINELTKLLNRIEETLNKIDSSKDGLSTKSLSILFNQFDEQFKKITNMDFYTLFLLPMARVQNKIVANKVEELRFEKDNLEKGKKIVEAFKPYINLIKENLEILLPIYREVMTEIQEGQKIELAEKS